MEWSFKKNNNNNSVITDNARPAEHKTTLERSSPSTKENDAVCYCMGTVIFYQCKRFLSRESSETLIFIAVLDSC